MSDAAKKNSVASASGEAPRKSSAAASSAPRKSSAAAPAAKSRKSISKKDEGLSVECGTAKAGEGAPRRDPRAVDKLESEPEEGCATVYHIFNRGLRLNPDGNCLGRRDGAGFAWESYSQIDTRRKNAGAGLRKLGVPKGATVGIYSKNCPEWTLTGFACDAYGFTSVALYDTLGEETREYVINHAELSALVVSAALLKNVTDLLPKCPKLKHLVVIGDTDYTSDKVSVTTYADLEKLGAENALEPEAPSPDDLAIIMYTSGTTGVPKGVMLAHSNVTAAVSGVQGVIPSISGTDVHLSYLPLAHIFERALQTAVITHGASIGFFSGDIKKLGEDIAVLRPTLFAGVPKVYERFYNQVNAKVNAGSKLKQRLFRKAFDEKRKKLRAGKTAKFWDTLVFNKVKGALGGRIRWMVSGGAPLGGEIAEFMRICFCAPILQGYALTETAAGGCVTPWTMISPYGKVGPPIVSAEVKLIDTTDGKYTSAKSPPEGEVLISGPSVTKGYFKEEAKTAEVFKLDSDGKRWFHSGDVGRWNDDGSLSIIGRTKDIFKLSQGEYVAPERVESVVVSTTYAGQAFVWGDSHHDVLVCVVVPDGEAAANWAKKNNVTVDDSVPLPNVAASLCANEDFQKEILADISSKGRESKLAGYEIPKAVTLSTDMWIPESGLVTPTLKNKRPQLIEKFRADVDRMYKGLGK